MEKDKYQERNSSIELLKIIAILMIIISHVIPFGYGNIGNEYINISNASNNLNEVLLQMIRYLGKIGNVIFLICSSWFLLEKKQINKKKVLYIIMDCLVVSIICLVLISAIGYKINYKTVIKQFFPITFSNNWFIACYIILYVISPFLNIIIDNMSKERLLKIDITLVLFNIWQFFKENHHIYNYLIGFIIIYFLIAYIKRYEREICNNSKFNKVILIINVIILMIFILAYNFFGSKVSALSGKMQYFTNIKNPIVFLVSLACFNLFVNLKIKNKLINYIASQTLLIYIIHDNYLIREFVRSDWFKYVYKTVGYNYIIFICVLSSMITFVITLMVSSIYKETIRKILIRLCNQTYEAMGKIYNKMLKGRHNEKECS